MRRLNRHRKVSLRAVRLLAAGASSALLVGLLVGSAAPGRAATAESRRAQSAQPERRLVLFYTGDVRGTVEPCGCTSDPLGDISRLAAMVRETRQAGYAVGVVDAGNLLFPESGLSDKEKPSANLRASFLAEQLEKLPLLGMGIGELDLIAGPAQVRPRRLAANLTVGTKPDAHVGLLRASQVQRVGQVSVGVLGVADPAIAGRIGATADDVQGAARREVERLRGAGAEVVVLLAPVDRNLARRLARDSGADVVVLGRNVGAGMVRAEKNGRGFLVAPQNELQQVGRLEIVLRGEPGANRGETELVDAGGPEASRVRREEINRALERLRVGLAQWTTPSGAPKSGGDASFVEAKKREHAELALERDRLERPWTPPASGSYLVNALIPLRRTMPRDPTVVAAMKKLDQKIAAENLRHAKPPPPAEPGRAHFVGTAQCVSCHEGAMTFWRKTVHAHAWTTLVRGGKQADYKCVGCHVTGFGEVGGSSLGFTRKLEAVQCESCHGPGSVHVAGEGNEEPLAIKRDTPESTCTTCHTPEHSDTFQYEAYLRDILGRGHGAKARDKLGSGPTGHELRQAALAKARVAGAAQMQKAKKM